MCIRCERKLVLHRWREWRELIEEGSWVIYELEQAAGRSGFTLEQAKYQWSKMGDKAKELARKTWSEHGRAWGKALREIAKEQEITRKVEYGKSYMCSIGLAAFVGASPATLGGTGYVPEGCKPEWGGASPEELEEIERARQSAADGGELVAV